jgi:flagellar basal-body rod protein FlgG
VIYGLYLSATGVLTNSYRQDVIANNLANSETVGFKRSLALFQERRTEAQSQGAADLNSQTDALLEKMGGGLLLAPTSIDHSQGTFDQTGQNLDVAIHGEGFFAIQDGNQTRLTRDGRFLADASGHLILGDGSRRRVLDDQGKPVELPEGLPASAVSIDRDGAISAAGQLVGRVGLFDVPDHTLLTQQGGTLLNYPDMKKLTPASGTLESGYLEQSNVDPMTELTQLINAQRQLEANANMIRYQDQTLGKLVSEVGKIG